MITYAQKTLIMRLYEELGMDCNEDEIDCMTRQEASRAIQELMDIKNNY